MSKTLWRFYFHKRRYSDTTIYSFIYYGTRREYVFRFNRFEK